LGRNDVIEQQITIFNWEPIQERERLLYQAAYGVIPENTKGRLKRVRLQGFASADYHHEYAGSDARFFMQVRTTSKDTTWLDYYWDRDTGMFTTLTTTRPAINAQLVDSQRQQWDRYEVTQYEFHSANGQISRISRWLADQDGNSNLVWEERYAYVEDSPWLQWFVDRQQTAYLFDYCSIEGPRLHTMTIQHMSGTPRWGFLKIGYSESENECNGLLPRTIQMGTNPDRTWRLRYSGTAENLAPNLLRFLAEPGRGEWEFGYYPNTHPYANKLAFLKDPTQRQIEVTAYDALGRPTTIQASPASGQILWQQIDWTLLGQPRVLRWSDGSQVRYLWEGTRLRAFDDPRAVFEYHDQNPQNDFANRTYLTTGSPRRLWFDYDPPEYGGLLRRIRFGGNAQGSGKLYATLQYDAYGRLQRVEGGNGVGINYSYGEQHELRAIHYDGDATSERFDYEDCCGRLRSWTRQDGSTAFFSYTPNGWLSEIRFGSASSPPAYRYDYDGAGRLGRAENALSRLTFRYDTEDANFGMDPPTSSELTGWLWSATTELKRLDNTPLGVHQQAYTYYPSGDVETITHHWNGQPFSTLRYEYDDARRLLRIFYSGHLLAEYSYDGAGRLRNQTVYPLSGGAPLQAHITYADNQSVSAIGTISWQFGNNLLAHFDYTGATASSVEPNDRYQGRGYYPDGTVRRIDEQLWDPGQNRYRTYHWWLDYGVEGALQRSRLDSNQAVTERTYTYDEGGNLRSRSALEANTPWYYEDNQLYYVPAERWFFTYTARGERRLWYTEAQRLRSDVNHDGQVDDADRLPCSSPTDNSAAAAPPMSRAMG
jgi:hypothetical protein